jgi:hypothetical protein
MKQLCITALLAIGISLSALGAAPPVGSVSDDVGFSESSGFNGSNYATLTQKHLSDYPDTVLALVFVTPW